MSPTGVDRDLIAVVINLKEQRYLEKCLQTIDMEKKYTTKIFELDLRILNIYLKRLKERISHIKSNLTVEEICQVKELESQGKLGTSFSPIVSNSALKIAAAYRCLKLEPNIKCHNVSKTPTKNFLLGQDESIFSSSVSSEESMYVGRHQDRETSLSTSLNNKSNRSNNIQQRPSTSACSKRSKRVNRLVRPTTAPIPVNTQFSSHVEHGHIDDLMDYLQNAEMALQTSLDGGDVVGSNFGENQFEEKRMKFLQTEVNKSKDLNRKTKDFLDNLNSFISASEKNSKLDVKNVPSDDTIFGQDVSDSKNKHLTKTQHSIHFNPLAAESKEDYQEKIIGVWKDLNKCRYLRVSDDMIDLSGVVTLARDHMKQFASLHDL